MGAVVAAALVLLLAVAGTSSAWTPRGAPAGLSAPVPTSLVLKEERTELVYHGRTDSLSYACRARLHNPGVADRFVLEAGFTDAGGSGEDGPPACQVRVNDGTVEPAVEAIADTSVGPWQKYRFRFSVVVPGGSDVTIEVRAGLVLVASDCGNPPYHLLWRVANDRAFDVTQADREALFTFDPVRSPVGVYVSPAGGVLQAGAISWHWTGPTRSGLFDVEFLDNEGDAHLDWFPTPYVFSSYVWDRHYLDLAENCSIEEIVMAVQPGAPDTLTAGIREWIRSNRAEADDLVRAIAQHHAGTASDSLNPVERRNLESAMGILRALDETKRPSEILRALAPFEVGP